MSLSLLLLSTLASVASAEVWKLAGVASKPPGTRRSLFGYTVAVQNGTDLLVADPVAYNASGRTTSGMVYRMPVDEVKRGSFRQPRRPQRRISFDYYDPTDLGGDKNFSQFGAAIATLPSGEAMICAPGYNHLVVNWTAAYGVCLFMRGADDKLWLHDLLHTADELNATTKSKDMLLSMGGFAVQLVKKGSDYYFGFTGPFAGEKAFSIVKFNTGPGSREKKVFTLTNLNVEKKVYFGYSLATDGDRFYATQPIFGTKKSIFYTIDALTEKSQMQRTDAEFLHHLDTSYNYMGYSSAFVDSFLLLGAPYDNISNIATPNRGCVYFIETAATSIKSVPPRYCNSEPYGMFGASLANVGDINGDKVDDFAVGCPGCDKGAGAVFLFFGRKSYDTQDLQPYQVFRAKQLSKNVTGFGFSLGAGTAPSKQHRLAIGAVLSNHAVLLETQPMCRLDIEELPQEKMFKELYTGWTYGGLTLAFKISVLCKGVGKKNRFSVSFSFDEHTEQAGYERFDISCETAGSCRVKDTLPQRISLRLKPVSRSRHNIPQSVMRSDVRMRLRWNFTEYPFDHSALVQVGDVIHTGKVNSTVVTLFRITPCTSCEPAEIGLKLLSEEKVSLQQHKPVPVRLRVSKSKAPFFGGVALRMSMSEGVSIDNSSIKTKPRISFNYYQYRKEILLSEIFPTSYEELFVVDKRKDLELSFLLRLNNTKPRFSIRFELANHLDTDRGPSEPALGSSDTDPSNNNASVHIQVDTWLLLDIYRKRGEDTIVDVRKQSSNAELRSLSRTVHGSRIGPELTQTYKLIAVSRPPLPVEDISITVRLPFVAANDELLLYFARRITTTEGSLPGTPYLSDSEFASDDSSRGVGQCEPTDEELAKLLYVPDLALMESPHSEAATGNSSDASGKSRVARSVARRHAPNAERPPNSTISFASSGSASAGGSPKLAFVQLFDCDRPEVAPVSFRCISFRCRVSLRPSDGAMQAFLHLHARLWSPTFFDRRLPMVKIKSSVDLDWKLTPAFSYANVTRGASFTQTFVFEGIDLPREDYPWGYVVLAIFIGLWLLLLFILLLWYCNFFRRRKFDYQSIPQRQTANDDDNFYH